MTKRQQKSGSKRMAESGKTALMPWFTAEERRLIDEAAAAEGLKATAFVRSQAVKAAQKITGKKIENPEN